MSGFKFDFRKADLAQLLHKDVDEWYNLMVDILPDWDINTEKRVAAFLAQCMHESNDFTRLEENLNYSAKRLSQVFPKYFRDRDVNEYARNPEKIANLVYANKIGNGDEASGDGYRFRGRGVIQLTGRYNYQQFANGLGVDIDEVVEYIGTKGGALESACWYWDWRKINDPADAEDFEEVTRRINTGLLGYQDRFANYLKAKTLFSQ